MEMEQNTAVEPEEAWYKDETDDFQEKLMDYHHRYLTSVSKKLGQPTVVIQYCSLSRFL